MRHKPLLALVPLTAIVSCAVSQPAPSTQGAVDPRYTVGELLDADDFCHGTDRWRAEHDAPIAISANDGTLDVQSPAGLTLWFKREFTGPVQVEYEATVVMAGGAHDRLSDLNCFWMARDARSPDELFATERSGRFADYNALLTYYASIGGNGNTTTRFRRYIGSTTTRPLDPAHDLRDARHLLEPNRPYQIRLVAAGGLIQFWRDGEKLFELIDPEPYTRGHLALRTVTSHLRVRNFRVHRLHLTRPLEGVTR